MNNSAADNGTMLDDDLMAIFVSYRLKHEDRKGWILKGLSNAESVAAHSWGVAFLVLALEDRFNQEFDDIDINRAVRLAVIHDLAEAITGDIPAFDGNAENTLLQTEKLQAELLAIKQITPALPSRILEDWQNYEKRESIESIVVKDCDVLDTLFQVIIYEPECNQIPTEEEFDSDGSGPHLAGFFHGAKAKLRTLTAQSLYKDLYYFYRAASIG